MVWVQHQEMNDNLKIAPEFRFRRMNYSKIPGHSSTSLTDDRRLWKYVEAKVHGIIFLLGDMVRFWVVSPVMAAAKLDELVQQNARFQKSEISQRIRLWRRETID